MVNDGSTTVSAERKLTIVRVFDAPRDLVFKAWTEPERVQQWMGPGGFACPDFAMEPEVGGEWHTRIKSDDQNLAARGRVLAFDPPERLSFTFGWDEPDGTPGREMIVTITFAETGGKTEMTFHQEVFDDKADRDGHNDGWSQSFDKLEAYLATAT
jgi:uncharacterized protein YndB with AHSA1/START domain